MISRERIESRDSLCQLSLRTLADLGPRHLNPAGETLGVYSPYETLGKALSPNDDNAITGIDGLAGLDLLNGEINEAIHTK